MVATWEPLLRHFGNAVDRGLRVVVTHRASDISTAEIHASAVPHQLATHPPPASCWVRDRTATRLAG